MQGYLYRAQGVTLPAHGTDCTRNRRLNVPYEGRHTLTVTAEVR